MPDTPSSSIPYAPPGPAPALAPTTGSIDSLINVIRERRAHALNRYVNFFRKVARWYDLYRGIYSGRFQPFRNNIHIPFLFSVIQSDVARKVQTSFGAWPIVDFIGYGHGDQNTARKNATLISAQMKDCDSFVKAVDFFLSADMYGTGIARVGWKQERRMEQRRSMLPGSDGASRESVVKGYVNRFDGPNWDVIDILDFWGQPGKRSISEMAWVIHRYYLDLDEVDEMAALGIFDSKAVSQLKKGSSLPTGENEGQGRLSIYRSSSEFEARRTERYARPVEIWDMWGRVPAEFASDGLVHRVVTLANGTTLLRNRPMPFWHGQLPFLAYSPMPDPHYFHGPGKVEIGEKMQFAANRFANQKMDGLDIGVDMMWLVDRSRGINTSNLYSRAGRVIGVDGPVDESVIRPISPDMRGLQLAYQEIATLWGWIQQGTGIVEDTVSGMPSSGRQTAREFMGRQENVLTRLMLEARLAEEAFIEPLANQFVELNKQFLTVPHEVKILGSDATVNPITGYPMPQEPTQMGLEDINHNYRARAVGATQMLGRQVRQQNLMALLQTMQVNPVAVQMVNWASFLRQTFEAFDFRNIDELLLTQPNAVNQQAAAGPQKPPTPEEQQNAAMSPQGMGGQGGPQGGGMPPEVMQEIMGQMGQ